MRVRGVRCLIAFAAGAILLAPCVSLALDDSLYAEILREHTRAVSDTAGTRVDYRGLRDSAKWRALLASLAASDPSKLEGHDEKFAFWSNAYNILAIDTVLRGYPVESIRDLGSLLRPVWVKSAGKVGGRDVTLDEIEHRILRPMGDPRVHVALVCASISCPSLPGEPWRAKRLDAQLDDAIRGWLASPTKGARIDRGRERITISKVFDWFEDDFEASGGVLDFVARHLPEADRRWIETNRDDLSVGFLDYDWSLNDLATVP